MDYQMEQEMELEALQAILMDDLQSAWQGWRQAAIACHLACSHQHVVPHGP